MLTLSLCQVQDLAAAVLNDNENAAVPDEITVCSTMYIDMDDCDGMTPNRAKRIYPTWSIINEDGKAEMSCEKLKLKAYRKARGSLIGVKK